MNDVVTVWHNIAKHFIVGLKSILLATTVNEEFGRCFIVAGFLFRSTLLAVTHTLLEESHDKNLTIPNINTLGSPAVTIAELGTLGEYDRATLQVTAQKVKDPLTVSNGKQKQDIIAPVIQRSPYGKRILE